MKKEPVKIIEDAGDDDVDNYFVKINANFGQVIEHAEEIKSLVECRTVIIKCELLYVVVDNTQVNQEGNLEGDIELWDLFDFVRMTESEAGEITEEEMSSFKRQGGKIM